MTRRTVEISIYRREHSYRLPKTIHSRYTRTYLLKEAKLLGSFQFDEIKTEQRVVAGPWLDLHFSTGHDDQTFVTFHVHDAFVEHSALSKGMEPIEGFLKDPGVHGMGKLVQRSGGAFLYSVNGQFALTELLQQRKALGTPCGVRAALEFLNQAIPILDAASLGGEEHGVYAHGALGPHCFVLDSEGALNVIGHGIPPADIFSYLDEKTDIIAQDSLKYTPAERLEGHEEDVTAVLRV